MTRITTIDIEGDVGSVASINSKKGKVHENLGKLSPFKGKHRKFKNGKYVWTE